MNIPDHLLAKAMSGEGAPQSLREAINNGVTEAYTHALQEAQFAEVIERHVLDYYSQRFNIFTLNNVTTVRETAMRIWKEVINYDRGKA